MENIRLKYVHETGLIFLPLFYVLCTHYTRTFNFYRLNFGLEFEKGNIFTIVPIYRTGLVGNFGERVAGFAIIFYNSVFSTDNFLTVQYFYCVYNNSSYVFREPDS